MTPIKVGVVNADALPADSPLEAPLGSSIHDMFFDDSVRSWITAADYADEAAARAAVNSQEIGVAVIIPQNFTAESLAGNSDAITILQDPLTMAQLYVIWSPLMDGGRRRNRHQVINAAWMAMGKSSILSASRP
jgi:hypothetical protein